MRRNLEFVACTDQIVKNVLRIPFHLIVLGNSYNVKNGIIQVGQFKYEVPILHPPPSILRANSSWVFHCIQLRYLRMAKIQMYLSLADFFPQRKYLKLNSVFPTTFFIAMVITKKPVYEYLQFLLFINCLAIVLRENKAITFWKYSHQSDLWCKQEAAG